MRILFLFAALIFITSCEKEDLVTMVYQETQCSDVWQDGTVTTEENIMNYFDNQHNIELGQVVIKTVNSGQVCLACHCTTGREIIIYVDEAEVLIAESEGFGRK